MLLILAGVVTGAALLLRPAALTPTLIGAGVGLALLALLRRWLAIRRSGVSGRLMQTVTDLFEADPATIFVTDDEGRILRQNPAARGRFGDRDGASLIRALSTLFASPSSIIYRLQERASAFNYAAEDVSLKRGVARLSTQRLGHTLFLWRLEEIGQSLPAQAAPNITVPMLVAAEGDAVLAQNDAMRAMIGGRASVLDDVISDLPLRPGRLHHLRLRHGIGQGVVVENVTDGGAREIFVLPRGEEVASPVAITFETLPVPILRLNAMGEVREANRLAREILGFEEVVDHPLSSFIEGLGRPISDWLAESRSGGFHRSEVVRAKRPDAELFVQITVGPVEGGSTDEIVAVLHDATELKTLEAQFVQSQKMQAIGQLAGGVAHDFNNLLTAISGHCDLLRLRHDDERDPDYSDLEQINQNANRAASLVGQLLAFSRKQNLQPELLDLRDILADLTHLLNRLVGERITLSFDHDPGLKLVRADRRQLEQVIMNLVVNARDAMPDGGVIEIETRGEILKVPMVRDRVEIPAGTYVKVRVKDSGTGIPADKLPKIFEPFYTTKKQGEGTGLGLSTAYGIVKQTGGFIFADSVVGHGTIFSFYFPAHERPLPVRRDPTPSAAVPTPALSRDEGVILLVEDEAPVRAFAGRALRMRGYTVIEAASAEEALDIVEDVDLHIDVFVTDIIMPGLDGPTWVQKAIADRPGARVVFVSGYAEESFADDQARIPNSVFLPKPFSLSQLTETVQRQMR
ncbi:ATP-binding protein [Mesobaculum littorinae]|uniref:ATP-binding protein n=1 Tax=Mesobaculum littorinae TaxID=2486419 RepID=UPI001F208729|nr:ATP-binding protein [Mesobaculum littorinae]